MPEYLRRMTANRGSLIKPPDLRTLDSCTLALQERAHERQYRKHSSQQKSRLHRTSPVPAALLITHDGPLLVTDLIGRPLSSSRMA
jgi:hypothetical protein